MIYLYYNLKNGSIILEGLKMEAKQTVKQGDKVLVHYTGKLENGEIFDRTKSNAPFALTIGSGKVLAKFEKNLIGMKEGETKSFCIPSEEAYGPLNGNLMIEILREHLPGDIDPFVGMRLSVPLKFRKKPISVKILAVNDISVTVDANHNLAGRDLFYTVEIVSIKT